MLLHRNTAKGSWNLPISDVVNVGVGSLVACDNPVLFTWDPVVEYHLWTKGVFTANLIANTSEQVSGNWLKNHDCVWLVRTNAGSYKSDKFFEIENSISGKSIYEGPLDPFSSVKRKLGADVPDRYVRIIELQNNDYQLLANYFAPGFFSNLEVATNLR